MKKILTAVLALGLFAASASAAEIKTNPQQGLITVSGNIERGTKVKEVSVNILYPGKTIADIKPGETDGVVAFSAQIPANADGSFLISAPIDGGSGIYTVYASYAGNDSDGAKQIRFVTAADNEASVKAFFETKSADEMKKVLSEQWLTLSFDNADYDSLDTAKTAEKAFALKEEASPETKDWETAQNLFDKACALEKIAEGRQDKIEECFDLLGIDKTRADAEYIAKAGETFGTYFKGVLKNMSYNNLGEFSDKLTEATVLSVVYTPNGNGEIKNMFKEYADKIGVKNPSDDTSVYAKLAGKSYADYAALKSAYQNALTNKGGSTGGGGGGGGGTSGGSSGGKKTTPSTVGIVSKPTEAGEPIEQKPVFSDLDGVKWAEDAILALSEKGIVSGKADGVFAPNDPLTREQFVTMIVKAFDLKTDGTIEFADVKPADWFYDYVNAAFNNNIVRGYGDSFGVGEKITRQDMAVMVYNAISDKKEFAENGEKFADDADIADYAREAIYYLKNAGIINGVGDGRFDPKGINTRAQAAVVINKLLGE